ncbi:aldo/keto reductase [Novosphingobium sp. fls2-241-R2A-195]|jgi:D-threo-aldose 1-dehydrogenase|uniref:aldo/keto reductase n=1 Tax=Novosphingobium sp. fls2-241-R2A-195 TaxID=3040296 RepID=UPI0025506154|nr:aldo/keto reductase [Novosphingobium sp. fls2-241-R2A-195]
MTPLFAGTLGFGSAAIGNLYRPVTDAEAFAVIEAAWAAGLRYFDTAPHYGFGLSEKRLGEALAALDPASEAVISTKIGRKLDPAPDADLSAARQGFVSPEPFESVFDYGYDAVMRSYEASLKRLRRNRIDILLAHDIGRYAHGDAHEDRMREFLGGGLRAMQELRTSGAVRAIGLGVNETAVCEEVLGHADLDVILLAGRYTLLEQAPLDGLFPLCARRGVQVVAGAPFNSGILARGVRHHAPAQYEYGAPPPNVVAQVGLIEDLCAQHGIPLAAAALQFPVRHPVVEAVIPGIASPDELASAVTLAATPIPETFWKALAATLIDKRAA